jgi:hypothetical protein
MLPNLERMTADPDGGYLLYAKKDNEPIFYGRAEVWPLVLDLPKVCYFADLGQVEPSSPAELVRIVDSGVYFPKGDLRREVFPLVVRPSGYRRILRIAWASSERIVHTPISLAKAGVIDRKRWTRLAPPGAPGQPIAFRRSFPECPVDGVRFLVATWESPRVVALV